LHFVRLFFILAVIALCRMRFGGARKERGSIADGAQ
jgi:hypothetical protein